MTAAWIVPIPWSAFVVGSCVLAFVVIIERTARRLMRSRAYGWLIAYPVIGLATLLIGPAVPRSQMASWSMLVAGAALATVGYPLGRALLGDRPPGPPPDSRTAEAAALGLVVAPVEELVWGALVQPVAGVPLTAALFAIKHPLVDGRWRRTLGLFLFWLGLGIVRAWNWPLALAVHVALNLAGVMTGHRKGVDQF